MGLEAKDDESWSIAADVGGGVGERILVSVRLRPLSEAEVAREEACDWECISDNTIIYRTAIPGRPLAPTAYTFDRVFNGECSTKQVYMEAAKEAALSIVNGINATVFAYGQTSSGKTYTMMGVIELAIADIFGYIDRHEERVFLMKFSGIEIYNEAVKDLLKPLGVPLKLRDDPERGVIVEKLTEEVVKDWTQFKQLLSICESQRQIGETSINEASSRSHQIIKLTIESSAREFMGKDNASMLVASVNFVDLAGSERASQAICDGVRLKEGCHINRSLLSLGTVIRKLSNGRHGHIPYRDSKLTRILQPALGGNARTAIICTLCPGESQIEQSRNTLLFASCAREVVTNAQVNVVVSDKALVKQLQKEVARLESELRRPESTNSTGHLVALLREKDDQIKKMEKEMKEVIKQRDIAESRLRDLLQNAKEQEDTSLITSGACEDARSSSETSSVTYEGLGFTSRNKTNRTIMTQIKRNENSLRLDDDFEDACIEVQCIDMDEPHIEGTLSGEIQDENPSLAEENQPILGPLESSFDESMNDPRPCTPDSTVVTLEEQLMNVRKISNGNGIIPDTSSSVRYFPSSRVLVLSRSRSCRAVLTNGFASPWFYESRLNDGTPPSGLLMDFPGRPSGLPRAHSAQNYTEESEIISGLKEMARKHYGDQIIANKETHSIDVGLDPILDTTSTPDNWPVEFEKKRLEIIELWNTCLVPIVHRTYFFLLFTGDPADSIYIEVELRRLSYLQKSLYGKSGGEGKSGHGITLLSSARNLRYEQLMLCRQMNRKLSTEERENLFKRWRIPLDSKQRKLQLVQRLWTKTKNMDHIKESASVVAKVMGLLEPGEASKEMFGLSIAPEMALTRQKPFRWISQGFGSFS